MLQSFGLLIWYVLLSLILSKYFDQLDKSCAVVFSVSASFALFNLLNVPAIIVWNEFWCSICFEPSRFSSTYLVLGYNRHSNDKSKTEAICNTLSDWHKVKPLLCWLESDLSKYFWITVQSGTRPHNFLQWSVRVRLTS